MADIQYYHDIENYLVNSEKFPEDCPENQKRSMRKRVCKYELRDNELYYNVNGTCLKIVFSETVRWLKIKNAHDQLLDTCHFNRSATYRFLLDDMKVYWKTMLTDINEYVAKNCDWCSDGGDGFIKRDTEIKAVVLLLGPFPESAKGYKFIGLLGDPNSTWIEATPMKQHNGKELAKFIETVYLLYQWRPLYFVDMEPDFVREIDRELVKRGVLFPNKYTEANVEFSDDVEPNSYCQLRGCTHNIGILSHTIDESQFRDIASAYGDKFATVLTNYITSFEDEARLNPLYWKDLMVNTILKFRDEGEFSEFGKFIAVGPDHRHVVLEIDSTDSDENETAI